MKKRIVVAIGLIAVIATSLVGCVGKKEITSKDFNVVANSIEGNDSKHSVMVEFEKVGVKLKYYLYQDGEEIATGEVDKNGKSQEYILENKKSSEITYKLKVVTEDDELIKETVYKCEPISGDNDSKEEDKSDSNNNSGDISTDSEQDNTTSTSSNLGSWSGESKEYKTADRVKFDNVEYECIMGHTSQADWSPSNAASLWKKVQ